MKSAYITQSTVYLTQEQSDSKKSGGFGSYIKLDHSVGLKMLYSPVMGCSLREAAEYEYMMGKAAEKSGFTPKYYGAVRVIDNNVERWGILIEHIEGTTLDVFKDKKYRRMYRRDMYVFYMSIMERLRDFLSQRLESTCGVKNIDLHERNIMIKKSGRKLKVYAIDFSAECAWFVDNDNRVANRRKKWHDFLDFDRGTVSKEYGNNCK